MALNPIQLSQHKFLMAGGAFELPLAQLREKGILPSEYEFHEYPKMIRISRGIEEVNKPCEDVKGRTWVEKVSKEVFDEFTVHSPEEEDRVLSGGKSSAQIEDERQTLIVRARNAGLRVDPSWSVVRLRRELGEVMDAPEDDRATLVRRLAELEELAAMKAKIAELEAQVATPRSNEADELRNELAARGVQVDGRWSVKRLREEMEKIDG